MRIIYIAYIHGAFDRLRQLLNSADAVLRYLGAFLNEYLGQEDLVGRDQIMVGEE